MRSLLIVISTGMVLAGCSLVYTSPKVTEGKTDAGINVDVVPLTFSSADFANRLLPYDPKPLPASLQVFGAPSVASPALTGTSAGAAIRARWPEPLPVQSYRLGVGDALLFSPPGGNVGVVSGEAPSGLLAASAGRQKYTVQDDGSISIPDIGRIRVEGMTLPQVEQAIFQALLERQKEPSFSVEIAEFNSQRVDVGGLVAQPVSLPITLTPLYLREALSAAGGSTVASAGDAVVMLYRDGEAYRMRLSDIYSNTELGQQVLKDGDSIFVDSTYFGDRSQINARAADREAVTAQLGMGAYPQDYVYLVGEVKNQLRIPLPFERTASLADILFSKDGGGFDLMTANVGQIYVLRFSKLSGRVTAYHLDAGNVGNLVVSGALQMRPDDFVFVAEQPITKWNRVIQQSVPSFITSTARAASGN